MDDEELKGKHLEILEECRERKAFVGLHLSHEFHIGGSTSDPEPWPHLSEQRTGKKCTFWKRFKRKKYIVENKNIGFAGTFDIIIATGEGK